jgi:predicted RNA polymerase sigma factor
VSTAGRLGDLLRGLAPQVPGVLLRRHPALTPASRAEAILLTRMAHRSLPDDGEVAGLLSLMLLTGRRAARTGPAGDLVPLAGQDRNRWDAAMIEEGAAPAVAARRR